MLNNPHIILPCGHTFELEYLFLYDKKIHWIEAKSGDYQTRLAKYAGLAKALNLDTKHSMMVLTDIPESECEKGKANPYPDGVPHDGESAATDHDRERRGSPGEAGVSGRQKSRLSFYLSGVYYRYANGIRL